MQPWIILANQERDWLGSPRASSAWSIVEYYLFQPDKIDCCIELLLNAHVSDKRQYDADLVKPATHSVVRIVPTSLRQSLIYISYMFP
jgi:hypothetical protein